MKKLLLAVIAAAAMTVLPCAAQAEQMGVYVAPKFVFNMQVFKSERQGGSSYGHTNFDTSFGGALAVGYDMSKNLNVPFRLELEYGVYGSVDQTYHKKGHTVSIKAEEQLQTLLANWYWDITEFYGFKPYVGVGAGVAFLKSKASMDGAEDWSADHRKGRFCGNLGAGVSYALNEMIDLDLQYRCLLMSNGFAKGSEGMNLVTRHNYAHQFALGVRFTF